MSTVLVTGATGNIGTHVVEHLMARGATVRAFARNPQAASAKLGDVELVCGDLGDPASIRRALVDVDRVFLTAADGPDKVAHEQAVIDAAAAAGVELVVKLSALRADPESPLPVFTWHGAIEQHLHRSGIPAVVLQPSFFMSNLLMVADGVARTDTLYAPTGGAPVAMIDGRDVARVAAATLVDGRHVGRTLQLTGPAPITFHDIAAAISQAVGRQIEYVDLTPDQARPRFEGAGAYRSGCRSTSPVSSRSSAPAPSSQRRTRCRRSRENRRPTSRSSPATTPPRSGEPGLCRRP